MLIAFLPPDPFQAGGTKKICNSEEGKAIWQAEQPLIKALIEWKEPLQKLLLLQWNL